MLENQISTQDIKELRTTIMRLQEEKKQTMELEQYKVKEADFDYEQKREELKQLLKLQKELEFKIEEEILYQEDLNQEKILIEDSEMEVESPTILGEKIEEISKKIQDEQNENRILENRLFDAEKEEAKYNKILSGVQLALICLTSITILIISK